MNTNIMDVIQDIVHRGSFAVIILIIIITIVGLVRPQIFKRILINFSQRKFILVSSVFMLLLSATIYTATEPMAEQSFVSQNTKDSIQNTAPMPVITGPAHQAVESKQISELQDLPFTKQDQPDAGLQPNERKIIQSGKNGQKQVIYQVSYLNGIEVSRSIVSESVISHPTPEITATGSANTPAPVPNPLPQSILPTHHKQQDKNHQAHKKCEPRGNGKKYNGIKIESCR